MTHVHTTLPEDRHPAAVPPGYTLTGHGGEYTVTYPSGATVADGVGDVFDAVRAAQAHAARTPVTTPEPSHTFTLSLPVRGTVADLRSMLRQVPGTARLADVKILGIDVAARLTDLANVEMRFVGGAK